ncbi:MAG: hypothetical protein Q9M97_02025 [Candidatus Gracilibacteria bacterium]|nr:hypothetical protein [Candidatus Gracilibacteria bacterium]
MATNPEEDIDSPAKVQARAEEAEKERGKLEQDFEKNIDSSIIKDTDKLGVKDKKDIISRLMTGYGKDKEGFNLIDSLETVLLDDSLSLTVGPQSPEEGENFPDFKERVKEFKNELYGDIIESEKISGESTKIVEETASDVGDILETTEKSKKGGIEGTKDKISSRLDLDEKQINEKLNNTSEREKNLGQAKEIFFGKEQILEYSDNLKSESSNFENLKELGDNIIKSDKNSRGRLRKYIMKLYYRNLRRKSWRLCFRKSGRN